MGRLEPQLPRTFLSVLVPLQVAALSQATHHRVIMEPAVFLLSPSSFSRLARLPSPPALETTLPNSINLADKNTFVPPPEADVENVDNRPPPPIAPGRRRKKLATKPRVALGQTSGNRQPTKPTPPRPSALQARNPPTQTTSKATRPATTRPRLGVDLSKQPISTQRASLPRQSTRPVPASKSLPDTNPVEVQRLWHEVMSQRDTEVSRSRREAGRVERAGRVGRASRTTTPSLASGSQTPPASDSKTANAKTTDPDFKDTVLHPRAITIDTTFSRSAFAEFDTDEPSGPRVEYYKSLVNCQHTSVWLDVGSFADDVVREYRFMVADQMCEAEFASYAKETLLKRDPRSLEPNPERPWLTERMLELVAKPDADAGWREPPIVGEAKGKPYSYDIRPDCVYWLSLQAINPEYVNTVSEHMFVLRDRRICPYFTIEFKSDHSTISAANNQVAVASVLALYNRYMVRRQRLQLQEKSWTEEDLKDLRHYGLSFTGAKYRFWCITPKIDESYDWIGACMLRVYQNDCTSVSGVVNFVDWVNEIHRWGLTIHAPACELDIKLSVNKASKGIRISLGTELAGVDSGNGAAGVLRKNQVAE